MTTTIRTCAVCEQRFVVAPAHQLTCSTKCRLELQARRARASAPWTPPRAPCAPVGPHRISDALKETRATVTQMLAEGRRLARAS